MKTQIIPSLALIVALWCLSASAQETVPQSQDILKSYFVTGAVPTQNDFDEWIDTMFWYINATYTNSLGAAQSAQEAQAANNHKFASVYVALGLSSANLPTWTFYETNGFSSNSIVTGTVNPFGTLEHTIWLTNYFATPLTNVAGTPATGPLFFTCWEPPMSGGSFSGAGTTWQSYVVNSASGYVLKTNYFAVYVVLGVQGTNSYWFTFYQ